MPSSITLTVAHLPSSTSFFLSALQPLGYVYRARASNTIGFGPPSESIPPDFWITQEIPGVPAGAAHVAFPAISTKAVQAFFTAALKAGGQIHGQPCERDASGYYSAAVIDFDGNSIEAVYRPNFSDDKENGDTKSMVSLSRAPSKIPSKAPSFSRGTASRGPPTDAGSKVTQKPSGDILDSIICEARNAANTARDLVKQACPSQAANTTSGGSGDVIMGTLLGVAAGAALHYALNNHKQGKSESRNTIQSNYRQPHAIEAPRSTHSRNSTGSSSPAIEMVDNESASTASSRNSRHTGVRMIAGPPTSYKAPTAIASATNTTSNRDRGRESTETVSRSGSNRSHRSSRSERSSPRTIIRTTEEIITRSATYPSSPASRSYHSSRVPSRAPSISSRTVVQGPKDYPLPPSRAATWAGNGMSVSASKNSRPTKTVIGKQRDLRNLDVSDRELTPDDSISQISVDANSRKSRTGSRR